MPSNEAAYLCAKSANPLEVKSAPYTPPGEKEIVVKNGAVAINPVEWGKQLLGDLMFSWIKYPFVLGSDLAGEVVEVGKGVTRFKPGDRVLGHAVGMDARSNRSAEGAFQLYTVVRTNLAAPIPASMSYETACVLPLCLSTAACALFQKNYLALQYPSVTPKSTGNVLIVWGGSTSVGSNAIQLGVAAGYEVFTTASPKNFEYVKRLGASRVWDYHSDTTVHDILTALGDIPIVGAVAIGNGSVEACINIVAAAKGRKFVAQASVPWPETLPSSTLGTVGLMFSFVWSNIAVWFKSKMKRVETKFFFGSDLMVNEVSSAIYEDYLPAALEEGKYSAAPEPQVVGKGLENVQEALNLNIKGVSAKKLIVSL
ncbi:MAG: hypothetical protein LQ352_003117 [Teloschistes flavicans]|nr:MAG: hypothetical protein LQ352_003117 [Teloschistes flavicans]